MRVAMCIFALGSLAAGVSRGAVQNPIVEAHADNKGQMHIRMKDGAEKVIPADKEQVGADGIKISPDGSAVGWMVEVPNCCTSYPIPVSIMVYSARGKLQRFGDGMMIGDWKFLEGGRKIAYNTDTVHSNLAPQCALVEISTGKTLGHWQRGDGPLPTWAQGFADQVGSTTNEAH